MERVIRCGFGLLLALILPIWNAQGEQAPADDLPDFNVVPENAARAVLLHAATPECDTVYNRKNQMSPYQKRNVIFEGSTMAKTKCDFSFHLA